MSNDIVGPSCDELVVFEEGDVEREMSSHLAKAPNPDRGTQYYQARRESGGRGEFDVIYGYLPFGNKRVTTSFDQLVDVVVPAIMMQNSMIAYVDPVCSLSEGQSLWCI